MQFRFIPVCTGNVHFTPNCFYLNPVYPCVYREHVEAKTSDNLDVRFIPMYTGKRIITYCLLIKMLC